MNLEELTTASIISLEAISQLTDAISIYYEHPTRPDGTQDWRADKVLVIQVESRYLEKLINEYDLDYFDIAVTNRRYTRRTANHEDAQYFCTYRWHEKPKEKNLSRGH